jgi:hypothetical protein
MRIVKHRKTYARPGLMGGMPEAGGGRWAKHLLITITITITDLHLYTL